MPRVSVVIPTYNRAASVGTAIRSVLNQTEHDFEIVVVDDASADDTEGVVGRFRDPRVQYVRQPSNLGDAAARNVGILRSSGPYIAFLDDDDEWLPPKLELQTEFLRARGPDVGGVHTARFIVDKGTGEVLDTRLSPEFAPGTISITTSAVMVRRLCFETLGLFDEGIPFCSDYDMWIRIAERYRFGYIDSPLVRYSVHTNRLSCNLEAMSRGEDALLRKHGEFFSADGRRHAKRYLHLGVLYCFNREVGKGRVAFRKAIALNPGDPRTYFNLCLSLLGPTAFRKVKQAKERLFASAAPPARRGHNA